MPRHRQAVRQDRLMLMKMSSLFGSPISRPASDACEPPHALSSQRSHPWILNAMFLLFCLPPVNSEDDVPAIPDGRIVMAAAAATSGALIRIKVLRSMIMRSLQLILGLNRCTSRVAKVQKPSFHPTGYGRQQGIRMPPAFLRFQPRPRTPARKRATSGGSRG